MKKIVVPGGFFGTPRVFDAREVIELSERDLPASTTSCSTCCLASDNEVAFKTVGGEILVGYRDGEGW